MIRTRNGWPGSGFKNGVRNGLEMGFVKKRLGIDARSGPEMDGRLALGLQMTDSFRLRLAG